MEPRSRIRLRLTREGLAYVIVVMFVAAAAILRSINLLILLNGLMVAPLLLSWRISRSSLRRLVARRVTGEVWFAGRAETVFWEVTNRRYMLPAWQLTILDQASPDAGRHARGRNTNPVATVVVEEVVPGQTSTSSYRVRFPQRGRYLLGPAKVQTSFPFGLVRAEFTLPEKQEVLVAPAAGRLTTGWDRRLMSVSPGDEAVKRRIGVMGDEFFAVRPWRNGDSLRYLHWRSTAKHNRPMVRQFDRRSDRDVILVLDLWREGAGSDFPSSLAPLDHEIELILSFATTVVVLAGREIQGQVTIAICGSANTLAVSGATSSGHGNENLFRNLALSGPSPEPDLEEMLLEVSKSSTGGSPVYIISSRPDVQQFVDGLIRRNDQDLGDLLPWVRFLSPRDPVFSALFSPPEMLLRNPELPGSLADAGRVVRGVAP